MSDRERAVELAEGLRALADVIARNGGKALPLPAGQVFVQIDATVRPQGWDGPVDEEATKRRMQNAVRGMGRGKKDKVYNDYAFVVNKSFGAEVVLQVKTERGAVCRKVPTGRTIVHAPTIYTTPERIEEEFEWVCDDPLFAEPK